MKRPNIFNYATKELSQDAMICWFLECLKNENELYKNIGVEFIKFILEDDSLTASDIALDKSSPLPQYVRMDVYAVVCVRNKAIPLIFEDKTDTYLHGDQMKKYCKKVIGWQEDNYLNNIKSRTGLKELDWGKVRYIYFKTGYVFNWQKSDFDKQKSELEDLYKEHLIVRNPIYRNDIIEFLEKLKVQKLEDFLIDDYKIHLDELTIKDQELWNEMMTKIFDSTTYFYYSYQNYALKEILKFKMSDDERDDIYYAVRIKYRHRGKKCEYRPCIEFQQNRQENKVTDKSGKKKEERLKNADYIKDKCKKIFETLGTYNYEKNLCKLNKLQNENHIFMLFIDEEGDVNKACNFMNKFIFLLKKELSNDHNVDFFI